MLSSTKKPHKIGILIILLAISFIFLTRIQSVDKVIYEDKVIFTSYDSYYHARLIQNTVHNFPHRIWFDPYSLYPFGQPVAFGPLYDIIVAFVAIVISLGSPSVYLIEITAAIFPMLFTVLSVPLVYFISRIAFNRLSAIVSVIVFSVMNGEFLFRSMFGNADHHMAELFFSLLFVLFFILALKRRKIVFSLLAGLTLGCYFLIWYGAVIFSLMIILFLTVIYFKNKKHYAKKFFYFKNIFVIMIFPLIFYLLFSALYTLGGIKKEYYLLIFIIPILIALFVDKVRVDYKKILIGSLGILIFLFIFIGSKVSTIIFRIKDLLISKEIVSETYSVFALNNFSWHFYLLLIISFISLLLLLYNSGKNSIYLFIGIWSCIILLFSIMQTRFSYYAPANIALLIGYGATIFKNKIKLFTYIIILLFILIPTAIATYSNAKSFNPDLKEIYMALEWLRNNTSKPGLDYYAYYKKPELTEGYLVYNNSLLCEEEKEICLKNVCLPQSYSSINNNKNMKNKSCKLWVSHYFYEYYDYLDSAYSIMNVYPYGHLVTYIARRIPITNGFLYIRGLNPSEIFFITQEKNKAEDILNSYNSKYIILDDYSINAIQFMAARSDNKSNYVREIKFADNKKQNIYMPKYYKSISTRLYLYNGKEYMPKESHVLINNEIRKFNSYKYALDYIKKHNNSIIVGIDPYESPIPLEKIDNYQLVYESNASIAKNSLGELKQVKIFSYKK